MKFVSRYLIMNTNLNKKTIPFTYFKRIYSSAEYIQVGLAHNALALDHCAPIEQVYRCTGVEVYMWAVSTLNFLHACFDDAYDG